MKKNRKIPAIILLLISFWFSDLLAAQYFPDDLNMPARVKQWFVGSTSDFLQSINEPPLRPTIKDRNAVSYRFTFRGFKHRPMIIRLDEIAQKKWILTVKQTDYPLSDMVLKVDRKRSLTKEEVVQFHELFAELQFWQLPPVGALEVEGEIMDGTTWILEAVENGRYHIITRHSPKDSDRYWVSDHREVVALQKIKEKEGYPDIDRATSEEVNRKLVAVGEYMVKLSGLKLELD